jgi:hypothetical protein
MRLLWCGGFVGVIFKKKKKDSGLIHSFGGLRLYVRSLF